MSDEQQAVRNNVIAFVNQLQNSNIDFAIGLCRFGQSPNNGNPLLEDNGQLTQDALYFRDNVWMRNNTSGGTEPGYYAITQSASGFSFRPGSQRIFIIITDETPNQGGATQQQAIDGCLNNGINVYAMTNQQSSALNTVATSTGGKYYNITDPFAPILDDIGQSISNTYLVRYRSSDPSCNGDLRDVEIKINYDGNEESTSGIYMPCQAPIIYRNPATVALHEQAWAEHTPFIIEAVVIDNYEPLVNSVKLFYKNTLSSSYQMVNMVNNSGNIWTASVVPFAVFAPGFDYYITASDEQVTVSTPSVNPDDQPFQIAILPNIAPMIQHEAILSSEPNKAIDVNAIVADETNELSFVSLFYREYGDILYSSVIMQQYSGNEFSAIIPASFVTNAGVQYYIYAEDDLGVGSYHGTRDEPHFIEVEVDFWENHMNNGIALQIIETKGTNSVKYVGYEYITHSKSTKQKKAFKVLTNGYVYLEQGDKWPWSKPDVNFDNKIILWDNDPRAYPNAKQLGHISFEYDFIKDANFTRHAVIIFHNDDAMCINTEHLEQPFFPYSDKSPDYPKDRKWNYFQIGEYPVSMLIPPYEERVFSTSGYIMPDIFDSKPVLFVHGLNGTYDDYWGTTDKIFNLKSYKNDRKYQAWQFYYPNTMDIWHSSMCMRYSVESYLFEKYNKFNQKINLVTHSMGGLVTLEYLTTNSAIDNQKYIEKVLLSVPPIHGSYGATRNFKTFLGRLAEAFGQDSEGPCYRDMSLSSNFMWNLHKRDWDLHLDFNANGIIADDVFTIIMSTNKHYNAKLDLVHTEAVQHSDGIVAISSASLIDHNIGFVSMNGNHDDGRCSSDHMGNENFLPEFIDLYFSADSYDNFLNESKLKGYVQTVFDPINRIVKPEGQTLKNLETDEDEVDYKKGMISFTGAQNAVPEYFARLPLHNNTIKLKPNDREIFKLTSFNEPYIHFKLNPYSNSYFGIYQTYTWHPLLPINLDFGNSFKLPNQELTLQIFDNSGQPLPGHSTSFDFSNCRSHYETLRAPAKDVFVTNNETDIKTAEFSLEVPLTFNIDDQTSSLEFSFYSEDAWDNGEIYYSYLEMPDGTILDSTSALVNYTNYEDISNQRYTIDNPLAGEWKAWGEVVDKSSSESTFSVKANLQTELIAFTNMTDTLFVINQSVLSVIRAGILANDTSQLSDISISAEITNPMNESVLIILDEMFESSLNSFEYFKELPLDTSGYYFVKFVFSGVYNGFSFERALYHHLLIVDETPLLMIPDFIIDSSNVYYEIKPENYTYNLLTDSLEYSFEIINSTIDTSSYYANYDSISRVFFIATDLSSNGIIEIEVKLFLPTNAVIIDTFNVIADIGLFGQSVSLASGWSIISTYNSPDTPRLETIFADQITNSTMAIMLGKSGIFWPGYNINTIGDWNPYEGYKVRMNEDDQVIITGELLENKTVELPTGVSYLPMLSEAPVNAEEIFGQVEGELNFAFEIVTGLIYWPAGEIYTLEVLEPGKGYLVGMLETASVTFPDAGGKSNTKQNQPQIIHNAPWQISNTGIPHLISIQASAFEGLAYGDIISAFNSENLCVGMTQFVGGSQNLALVVYGDDVTTEVVDGMLDDELMRFVVYSTESSNNVEVDPRWNQSMTHTNHFAENGLSAITGWKNATAIDENLLNLVSIYPNPNTGLFHVDGISGKVEIQILNSTGQLVRKFSTEQSTTIDLSSQAKGIYFLKLVTDNDIMIEKIILE
jgi:pimeloyl-ACP methyl ester carboxylesterase